MKALSQIFAWVFALSVFTFIALFGHAPALRRTPVGSLYRTIWYHVPNAVRKTDALLTGSRLTWLLTAVFNRLVYEKHPIILVLFLMLLTGASAVFIYRAWPDLGWYQRHFFLPLFLLPTYASFALACSTDPGVITRENHAQELQRYPFDHLTFKPNNECSTCRLVKPARSKHCRVCKRCIGRYDHHCVWINNCVGRANYVWFLSFLLAISCLLAYGTTLMYLIIRRFLQQIVPASPRDYGFDPEEFRAWLAQPNQPHWTTRLSWWDFLSVWGFCIVEQPMIGIPGLLCMFCFPLAAGFLAYHIYLLWAGMTTNESMKFADVADDMREGFAWRNGNRTQGPGEQLKGQDIVFSEDRPEGQMEDPDGHTYNAGANGWVNVDSLKEVENIYDAGFVSNLWQALLGL